MYVRMELLRTALLCCWIAASHLREACWQSSRFIDTAMQWMLKQLIPRVYCIYSYSRILSIEHNLNSLFSLKWSVPIQICWKKSFYKRKEFNLHRTFSVHQHGRHSSILYNNMATVISCENHLHLSFNNKYWMRLLWDFNYSKTLIIQMYSRVDLMCPG